MINRSFLRRPTLVPTTIAIAIANSIAVAITNSIAVATANSIAIVIAVVLAISGCGGRESNPRGEKASPVDTTTTTTAKPIPVRVYFTRDEKIGVSTRLVPGTKAVAGAAIRELLSGPSATDTASGLGSTIPAGTQLRGLTVKAGTATVDLSDEYDSYGGTLSMTMRLAQVVYTLTQFPTIERVVFRIEGGPVTAFGGEGILIGTPQTRGDYEELTPAILVESPAPGETVRTPLRIQGTANTFEASFIAQILAFDGALLAEKPMMASSGSGTRGTFDASIPFTISRPGRGSLVVFESSAKDGTPIHVVKIPLELSP